MSEPPQFYQGESAGKESPNPLGTDRAIYVLPRKDKSGKPIRIAVECVPGGGNVPRNATSFRRLAKEIKTDWEEELQSVVAVAESVLSSLKDLRPGEVDIEFGVELGGELGIPLVTKGEAKANFKITLKWKDAEGAK